MADKYDGMTKAQLAAELRRVARREERLSDELGGLRRFEALAPLDDDVVGALTNAFSVGSSVTDVANGLRGLADAYDPAPPVDDLVPVEASIQPSEPVTESEGQMSNVSPTTLDQWLPAGKDDPSFLPKMGELYDQVKARRFQADRAEFVQEVARQTARMLADQQIEREAVANRDRVAKPFLEMGYSPANEAHVPALNLALEMRARGYPEEQVTQFLQVAHPIDAMPPSVADVAAAAEPVSTEAPTGPGAQGVTNAERIGETFANVPASPASPPSPPAVPQVAAAGTLAGAVSPGGAPPVPALNSDAFDKTIMAAVARTQAEQAAVPTA